MFHDDGRLDRIIGAHGMKPGLFRYPYDVEVSNNQILVLEYGSQRVQVLDMEGASLRVVGEPGRGPQQLFSPWRMADRPDAIYVA